MAGVRGPGEGGGIQPQRACLLDPVVTENGKGSCEVKQGGERGKTCGGDPNSGSFLSIFIGCALGAR